MAFPLTASALMKSDNYIIYESVMYSFDGPIISGVSCTPGAGSMTITWTTDVIADSFVIYDTDNGFANSKEQGSTVKSSTSQSVEVTGLDGSTLYYYKVRSTRANGGVTTDSTTYSCTTDAVAGCPTCEVCETCAGGGGGILIIDKTDKVAPLISDVQVTTLRSDTATITWTTDEDATNFVEYGKDISYGHTYGDWSYSTEHSVKLINLLPETEYNFKALSSDEQGNLGESEDMTFTTLSVEEEQELIEEGELEPEEEKSIEEILSQAAKNAIDIFNRLADQVSLNLLESTLGLQYDTIEKLANLIPPPILSGEPRVEVEANKATIYWLSDKEANSLVAIAPDSYYNSDLDEPYRQVVGNPEASTLEHIVEIFDLNPDTLYHYQLRSKGRLGGVGKTRDFTFRTSLETLQITSYYTQIVNDTTATFKWVTNYESDSSVKFTPYRGNILAVEESKTIKDNNMSVIHEITIEEFQGGLVYEIELSSQDAQGNTAIQQIPLFSTSEDDLPPVIFNIKVDSTVFLDKSNRTQTIIIWLTNEPTTAKIYWQEGVYGADVELINETDLNFDYTREHIMVFTKFKANLVYSFRVESIDSGGNVSMSKTNTFMTPKQQESILQIIIRILEDTFGWMKKLM